MTLFSYLLYKIDLDFLNKWRLQFELLFKVILVFKASSVCKPFYNVELVSGTAFSSLYQSYMFALLESVCHVKLLINL